MPRTVRGRNHVRQISDKQSSEIYYHFQRRYVAVVDINRDGAPDILVAHDRGIEWFEYVSRHEQQQPKRIFDGGQYQPTSIAAFAGNENCSIAVGHDKGITYSSRDRFDSPIELTDEADVTDVFFVHERALVLSFKYGHKVGLGSYYRNGSRWVYSRLDIIEKDLVQALLVEDLDNDLSHPEF